MAPSAFLSWSSADKAHVLPLRDRLRGVGLNVWEYTDDLTAGSDIHAAVVSAINQVQLAILCFSDATAAKQWIVDEAAWCAQTLLLGKAPLTHILPVWVGPHPKDLAPPILKQLNLRIADLTKGEPAVRHFVDDVFKHLGLDAPRVVPAALFAMTQARYAKLLKTGLDPALVNTCSAGGMKKGALQAPAFLARYGETPEDLDPFGAGTPLVKMIDAALADANGTRVSSRKRPVFLSWMRDEIVGPKRSQAARDEWAERDSLLVVDSVSTFDPEVQASLGKLPQPKRRDRAALLWVPPYTQQAPSLEEALRTAAEVIEILGDAFSDWQKSLDRSLAFDTSTPAGMRLWLRRAFLAVEDLADPVTANVTAMRRSSPNSVTLADMLAATSAAGAV